MKSFVKLIIGVAAVLFSAVAVAAKRTFRRFAAPIGALVGFLLFSSIAARAHPHATGAEFVPDGTVWFLLGAGIAAGVGYLARRLGVGANLYDRRRPDRGLLRGRGRAMETPV